MRLQVTVKGCNQTGMPCVGSSLFISFAGSRFPVACLSWSVSIGFPHACLPLRVVTGSDSSPTFSEIIGLIRWSQCCRQNAAGIWWQSWYNEKYWVVHCPSNCLPIFGHSLSFAVFHSYEYPRFEQDLRSTRIAGVSWSNCTVSNRSRSWTKTCACSFICTAPGRCKSLMVFWTFSQYPFYLSSNLLAQHCALKLPNPYQTYDLLCLWRLRRRIKRSCLRLELAYFLAKVHATLLVQSACREVSSGVPSQNWARKDVAHEVHLFGQCLQIALFFPEFDFVPGASWEFQVCPAEAFNSNSLAFRRIEFIGSEFWDTQHNLGRLFSFRISNWSWSTFFSTSRWVFFHRQHVERSNDSHERNCFHTCNHDTLDDIDNDRRSFSSCPQWQGIFCLVAGLPFRLFKLFMSVCLFTFGTEEYACSGWEFFCVSPLHPTLSSRSPAACVCRKNYKRLFLNKTQLSSAENILQSSARCKSFSPFCPVTALRSVIS